MLYVHTYTTTDVCELYLFVDLFSETYRIRIIFGI